MTILDNLIIMLIHVLCFIAGVKLANHYHREAIADQKEALERQYLRLKAQADADNPCKPYLAPRASFPVKNTGDFDGDIVSEQFMKDLKENGKAKMSFRKSDLTK